MRLGADISAVFTGGASGPGGASSRALARKGVRVAIFDLHEDKGKAVAADIRRDGAIWMGPR